MAASPGSPEELAALLADASRENKSIRLLGCGTKDMMGGPIAPADVAISTQKLDRVLRYEPRDLTISVEAGMPWRELTAVLAANRQMVPLDPPFSGAATVGGVIATNSSGPRRRLYGAARDMVIGMKFAMLDGKLIDTGGMVVKNVAGLDMGKLMIGSFGTLAAIASVNFRLYPAPERTRTFRWSFPHAAAAFDLRDAILKSVLQPMAIDIKKTNQGFTLLVQAGGSARLLDRYSRELRTAEVLEPLAEREAWLEARQFTSVWLKLNPAGAVVRVSSTLSELAGVMNHLPAPALARAGNGVCHGYFADAPEASAWLEANAGRRAVIEYAPQAFREQTELWPSPGGELAIMRRVKNMFDPGALLNRGRLHGHL